MTSISSLGSNNAQIYQYQLLAGTANPSSSDSSQCASASTAAATPGTSGSATSALSDLRSQIEDSVTQAVNQLDASASPKDIAAAVKNAVQQTLKANGIEPNQAGAVGVHHHHAHGAGGPPPASSGGTDADGDNDGDSTTSQTDPGSDLLTLLQALQNNASSSSTSDGTNSAGSVANSDPLLAALSGKSDASGNTNGSASSTDKLASIFKQLFANFPNGTALDVQA